MRNVQSIQVISAVSLILGLLLVVSGPIYLDVFIGPKKTCEFTPGDSEWMCESLDFCIGAGSLGIIGGIVQIFSFALAWFKKWKPWIALQFFAFILTLSAYAIVMDKDANYVAIVTGLIDRNQVKAFMTFLGIDFTFSVMAVGAGYQLTRA